jgi:hypothetical protein
MMGKDISCIDLCIRIIVNLILIRLPWIKTKNFDTFRIKNVYSKIR